MGGVYYQSSNGTKVVRQDDLPANVTWVIAIYASWRFEEQCDSVKWLYAPKSRWYLRHHKNDGKRYLQNGSKGESRWDIPESIPDYYDGEFNFFKFRHPD